MNTDHAHIFCFRVLVVIPQQTQNHNSENENENELKQWLQATIQTVDIYLSTTSTCPRCGTRQLGDKVRRVMNDFAVPLLPLQPPGVVVSWGIRRSDWGLGVGTNFGSELLKYYHGLTNATLPHSRQNA